MKNGVSIEPWQNGGVTLANVTSRRQTHGLKGSVRVVAACLLVASALVLSACSLLPAGNQDGTPAPRPASTTPAVEAAVQSPETPKTAAQEISLKLSESLGTLAASTKAPNREQMSAAMLAAGADPAKVEVSIDITPTGLAVDAIEAATLVETECVVGQVREGAVAVTILPVLESGRCFVGDVH